MQKRVYSKDYFYIKKDDMVIMYGFACFTVEKNNREDKYIISTSGEILHYDEIDEILKPNHVTGEYRTVYFSPGAIRRKKEIYAMREEGLL